MVLKKVLNILSNQGNANQNNSEILSCFCQNGQNQKHQGQFMLEGCGERVTLLHCWWKCKLIQPHWESEWQFLRKMLERI